MSVLVLKTAEAPSLSGKSTLTYQIGATSPVQLLIRISGNSGGGLYCKDWFDLSAIESCLSSSYSLDTRIPDSQNAPGDVGVMAAGGVEVGADRQNFPGVGPADLRAVIGRRSINTLGFVMAALNHLGLVRPSKHKPGKFMPQAADVFRLEMAELFQTLPNADATPDSSLVTEEMAAETPIAKPKRKSK
jgi:hypothetical protein